MSAAPGDTASALTLPTAPLKRRLLALIYEALILIAMLLAGALPVVMLTHGWPHILARTILQIWLLLLCGAFYVRQWRGTGQTLPMKTWRLKLVTQTGSALDMRRALLRYIAVLPSIPLLGAGYWWALIDRDRQFLHDRLAGTRLITTQD